MNDRFANEFEKAQNAGSYVVQGFADGIKEKANRYKIEYIDTDIVLTKHAKELLNAQYGSIAAQYKPKPIAAYSIKNVIFNPPATIVFWADSTKTVVKCGEYDEYDAEKGLAMAFTKKVLGNHGNYYNVFRKWLPEEPEANIEETLTSLRKNAPPDVYPGSFLCKVWESHRKDGSDN